MNDDDDDDDHNLFKNNSTFENEKFISNADICNNNIMIIQMMRMHARNRIVA